MWLDQKGILTDTDRMNPETFAGTRPVNLLGMACLAGASAALLSASIAFAQSDTDGAAAWARVSGCTEMLEAELFILEYPDSPHVADAEACVDWLDGVRDFDAGKAAYERGDFAHALRIFRLLAEQGNALAQNNLGRMYYDGTGVPEDFAEAFIWFRKAAERGNAWAQYYLGLMYSFGEGVPQDIVQGYAWINLASAQDIEKARWLRDRLRRGLGGDQIVEAQKLSREIDARIKGN